MFSLRRNGLSKEVKLESTGDRTVIKCHHCFNKAVTRTCHHCGRYMCEKCEPLVIRWLRRLRLYKLIFRDYSFSGLDPLESELRDSAHCRDHVHYQESLINLIVWTLGAVGLVLTAVLPFTVGWLACLPGLVFIGLALLLIPLRPTFYRLATFGLNRELVPIFPHYKINIKESTTANFVVDTTTTDYLRLNPAAIDSGGTLTVELQLTSDDYERYKTFGGNKNRQSLQFSAGYLGLDNLSRVTFNRDSSLFDDGDVVLDDAVEGVHHSGRVHLAGRISPKKYKFWCSNRKALKFQHRYEISDKAGWKGAGPDKEFLFWLVPDLSDGGRALTLAIYVSEALKNENLTLEYLKLDLPDPWYEYVLDTDGFQDETMEERINWMKGPLFAGINRFYVDFRTPLAADVLIQGEYKISIDNFLLSGLKVDKEKHLWYAGGEPILPSHHRLRGVSRKTEFSGEFHLNTSVFKLYRELTVEDFGQQEQLAPDHQVIAKIVDVFKDKIDVKSVIETPARIGEVRSDYTTWNHYWEIQGRFYLEERLQHVEVHVVVYGQENPTGPLDQEYVKWQLYLRTGLPLNDDKLEKHLRLFCDRLNQNIKDHLSTLVGDRVAS